MLLAIMATVAYGGCTDPPGAGQLVLDINRLALRPGVTQLAFTASKLVLFYGQAPAPPAHKDVDCSSGQPVTFDPAAVTVDLTRTGRTYVATVNAPQGNLREVWLVLSNGTVTENGLVRPLHTSLNCSSGESGVIRLTSVDPNGVQINGGDATEIAAQLDPNTDIDHKDPDNAGGNGNGKGNPDANGDLHGGRWSIAASLPFVLVTMPEGIVDGQIIVRFKDGTSAGDIQSAIAAQSMTVLREWRPTHYYVLQAPDGADERPILQYYAGLGSVQYTLPNTYVGTAAAGDFDPAFPGQSQWPQVGLNELCVNGTYPNCKGVFDPSSGWAVTTGSDKNVVAVVDDGFDLTNPDVYPNLFINTDEVPQEILDRVGDVNHDNVVDWHDLDADADGVLTFADLDSMNTFCEGTHIVNGKFIANCNAVGSNLVCSTTPCTPRALVTGAGRPDPNRNTCGGAPQKLNGSWEDGVDGHGGATCNGFVDDVIGWNFNCSENGTHIVVDGVSGCNLVAPSFVCLASPCPSRNITHGTTVASIVGAAGANGVGGVGVDWTVRLLPVQLRQAAANVGAQGAALGLRDSVYAAALYAGDVMKADVVNLSLQSYGALEGGFGVGSLLGPAGCPGAPPPVIFPKAKQQLFQDFAAEVEGELSDLQKLLQSRGTLAVVAAGNCQANLDATSAVIDYPGSMVGDNVLTVASVDSSDHLSSFSNYGTSTIDLAAPGESFEVSTVDEVGQYAGVTSDVSVCGTGGQACRGTSFSAPMVAGAAALVLTAANGSLDGKACQIADRILRNADMPGTGLASTVHGGRRLNVQEALIDGVSAHVRSCP